ARKRLPRRAVSFSCSWCFLIFLWLDLRRFGPGQHRWLRDLKNPFAKWARGCCRRHHAQTGWLPPSDFWHGCYWLALSASRNKMLPATGRKLDMRVAAMVTLISRESHEEPVLHGRA